MCCVKCVGGWLWESKAYVRVHQHLILQIAHTYTPQLCEVCVCVRRLSARVYVLLVRRGAPEETLWLWHCIVFVPLQSNQRYFNLPKTLQKNEPVSQVTYEVTSVHHNTQFLPWMSCWHPRQSKSSGICCWDVQMYVNYLQIWNIRFNVHMWYCCSPEGCQNITFQDPSIFTNPKPQRGVKSPLQTHIVYVCTSYSLYM